MSKTIEEADYACDGCSTQSSRIYTGKVSGIDTIKRYKYTPGDSCDLNSKTAEVFIVHVSE